MRSVVISFQKIGSGSYEMPTLKIAKFLSGLMNAEIADSIESAASVLSSSEKIGRLFIVSGMWQFCKFREIAVEIVRKAISFGAKLYFCCNDYKTPLPGDIKKVGAENIVRLCNGDYGPGSVMVNWNALTFSRNPACWERSITNRNMIYYGAYRDGRKQSFDSFFSGKRLKTFISTSERNFGDFKSHGPVEYEPIKDISLLAKKYFFTVYVSDKINHEKMFVFPANRFYECLSFGIFQFIDERTLMSFRDFDKKLLSPFVVKSDVDIVQKLGSMDLLMGAQKRTLALAEDYKKALFERLKNVL